MASTIPYSASSNLMKKSSIIPLLYSSFKPITVRYKPILRRLSYASPGAPPEFPGRVEEPLIPAVPPELPDFSPGPEIDPGSAPDEIVHTWPDEGVGPPPLCPEPVPVPGPDSPGPPPHGPDTLPPPTGPDVFPPDKLPRDPPPGVPPAPPLDPPGPTIVI